MVCGAWCALEALCLVEVVSPLVDHLLRRAGLAERREVLLRHRVRLELLVPLIKLLAVRRRVGLVLAEEAELAAAQALHHRGFRTLEPTLRRLQLRVLPQPSISNMPAVGEGAEFELGRRVRHGLFRDPLVADESLVLLGVLAGKAEDHRLGHRNLALGRDAGEPRGSL